MTLEALKSVDPAVEHVAQLIARLDRCFVLGFARLGDEQLDALESLSRTFTGTPLGGALEEAFSAIESGAFSEQQFVVLAAARAALQGAQHDALVAQAEAALGRSATASEPSAGEPVELPGPVSVWCESARQWLVEIALSGFMQLESATLRPFAATLEQLQGAPEAVRQAALLTGLLNELDASLPVASLDVVPTYRWVDLWSRAMLACVKPPPVPSSEPVSGTLEVLGVDLRHHASFASIVAWCVLNEERVVTVSLSAYKVDVIVGSEIWDVFPEGGALFKALSRGKTLNIKDMELRSTGELIWDADAVSEDGKSSALGQAERLFAPDASGLTGLKLLGFDRHPVQVAVPVFLSDYKVKDGVIDGELAVAASRMCSSSELDMKSVEKSSALFGLLRFDGDAWSVQPLRVQAGKSEVYTGSSAAQSKSASLKTLQGFANKLLRA